MESTKDVWDILKVVGTLVSGVLIPVAIFLVGQIYRRQKERSDQKSRELDKISQFIKHLTSENEKERIVALKVSKYLYAQNQLPGELISAVETLSITDDVSGSLASDILNLRDHEYDSEDIWKELEESLRRANDAFKMYLNSKKREYKWIKSIAINNAKARNFILVNSDQIPLRLRESANSLLHHYEDWLGGYRQHLAKLGEEPEEDDPFHYLAAPNHRFPREAEAKIMEYLGSRDPGTRKA